MVGFVATCEPVPRALVWLFIVGNLGWAAACVVLLAAAWVAPTTLGVAWIAAQAATVVAMAQLQWTGLRRGDRVAGWA